MAAAAVVEHPLGDEESEDDILKEEELDLGLVLMLEKWKVKNKETEDND